MDAPTAHRLVGTHEDMLVFERDLVELAAHLGQPRPEIRGYRLFEEGTRVLAYQVICQVRGKEVPSTSQEFTFEVIERTWGDGLMRVHRHAISCLVHLHYDELLGTRYEHYGRVDSDGLPYHAAAHTPSVATSATRRPCCTTLRGSWTMSIWSPTREAWSWPFFMRIFRIPFSLVTATSLLRGGS
jgi:hypothetical protein